MTRPTSTSTPWPTWVGKSGASWNLWEPSRNRPHSCSGALRWRVWRWLGGDDASRRRTPLMEPGRPSGVRQAARLRSLGADGLGLRLEWGGLGLAVGLLEQHRVFLEALGHVGMVGAEGLALERERPLVERLGLREAALVAIERGEVDDARGHLRVLGSEHLLSARLVAPPDRPR